MSAFRKIALSAAALFIGLAGFFLTVPAGGAVADCGWDTPCSTANVHD